MLAGEGGGGQVFCSSGRAYRDIRAGAVFLGKFFVGGTNLRGKIVRDVAAHNPLADLGAGDGQGLDIAAIERGERGIDTLIQFVMVKIVAIGRGGGGETVGNLDLLRGESPVHFAQGGVLASDQGDILHAQFGEAANIFHTPSGKPKAEVCRQSAV